MAEEFVAGMLGVLKLPHSDPAPLLPVHAHNYGVTRVREDKLERRNAHNFWPAAIRDTETGMVGEVYLETVLWRERARDHVNRNRGLRPAGRQQEVAGRRGCQVDKVQTAAVAADAGGGSEGGPGGIKEDGGEKPAPTDEHTNLAVERIHALEHRNLFLF